VGAKGGEGVPKLKPEELESRHREIVDAARRCFLRNGFHQTTTDDICREASITPGGLYHYFRGKEDVITAVIKASAEEAVARLSELAEDSANTRSSIRALAGSFTDSMRDSEIDSLTRLDVDVWAESLRNEKLAEITKYGWAVRRDWLRQLIQNARDEGVYAPEVDPTGLANLIMSMWIGLRLGRLLWGEEFNPEATLQALFLMHSGRLMPQRRPQPLRPAEAAAVPKPRKSAAASA
jgi:AcrR family transcriptional regulator